MSKLENILDGQESFQRLLNVPIYSKKRKNYLSDIFCTAMQREIFEFMGEYQNKLWDFNHRPDTIETNETNLKNELCDIFLFFCNIMLVWDITFKELIELVEKRQIRNLDRANHDRF